MSSVESQLGIEALQLRLAAFGLMPVMAAELECYVPCSDAEAFWHPVDAILRDVGVGLLRIEKERGDQQYEIITQVTTPARLVEWLVAIKTVIHAQAIEQGIQAIFAAKPYADQPSSSLQLHLHLADAEGINAYHKTEEWTSDALRWSLGGLLATLPCAMPVFFPTKEDYARLNDADHVPKIAGWGVNNRYCALRIPANPDLYDKRIEHRVPCANADPLHSVLAMLEGVVVGLEQHIEPPPQEHGKPSLGLLQSLADTAAIPLASVPA